MKNNSNPLKILRIIARLNIGGPAIHTVLLTAGMNNERFHTRLVTGMIEPTEGDMAYFAAAHSVKPEMIPAMKRSIHLWSDLVALWHLIRIMRQYRPDIVHTHTAKAGCLGRLAALLCRVPVIVHTFHGHVFDGYFSPLKTKLFLFVERFLGRFTDRILTVSEAVQHELIDHYRIAPAEKITVVPLGFDLEPFFQAEAKKGAIRKEFGIADDVIIIGIIGRLVPIKDHQTFLKAACVMVTQPSAEKYKVRFLIIGDGQLRPELEFYCKELGIDDDVIFTGWRSDLSSIYADCTIVSLTSRNEGTPVSLIEAMASGKAVVATRVGGVGDVITHEATGLLVSAGDVEALARSWMRLYHDPVLRSTYGRTGREAVKALYSHKRLIKDIEMVYNNIFNYH